MARDVEETVLLDYGQPLRKFGSFKYLGRLLSAMNNNFPVIMYNLRNLRNKWVQLSQILVWEGVDITKPGTF